MIRIEIITVEEGIQHLSTWVKGLPEKYRTFTTKNTTPYEGEQVVHGVQSNREKNIDILNLVSQGVGNIVYMALYSTAFIVYNFVWRPIKYVVNKVSPTLSSWAESLKDAYHNKFGNINKVQEDPEAIKAPGMFRTLVSKVVNCFSRNTNQEENVEIGSGNGVNKFFAQFSPVMASHEKATFGMAPMVQSTQQRYVDTTNPLSSIGPDRNLKAIGGDPRFVSKYDPLNDEPKKPQSTSSMLQKLCCFRSRSKNKHIEEQSKKVTNTVLLLEGLQENKLFNKQKNKPTNLI